ncbi:DUF5994 family protein [Streptomyces galilaeus]|uniref:DUF5994 family protein n=1 Tax=Streptomyces galilaeus TaxID=33899 RepID=UPI0019A8F2BF|nr:DUF5994 family protein [Streptomyces galilaeus]GGW54688.1 hypothetical protein GCM10010350_43960 [Streptomyces galilaeus]
MNAPIDHTLPADQHLPAALLPSPLLSSSVLSSPPPRSARVRSALRPQPSGRPLRLRLAPDSPLPRRVDGVWWPRSDDLLAELPQLLAGLPRAWGDIVSVMVNGTTWAGAPGRMLVCNQVVRLRRSTAVHAPDTVVLMAPGQGRRDLQVVPPDTTEEAAWPLMSAGAGGLV